MTHRPTLPNPTIAPPNVLEYEGDLLTAQVDVIAHQTNCTTREVTGFAAAVYAKHPWANLQGFRNPDPRFYGYTDLIEGHSGQWVANINAQLLSGRPTFGMDGPEGRLYAFDKALVDLSHKMKVARNKPFVVGFPRLIGCNLAGGDWTHYHASIMRFAEMNLPWGFIVHIVSYKP